MWRTIDAGQGRGKTLIGSTCSLQFLHLVERAIRCLKQSIDGCAVFRINRNSKTHGKLGLLVIAGQKFAYPASDDVSFLMPGLRQNNCEFVATIARGSVNRAAGRPEN